jgi:hypothetical protein
VESNAAYIIFFSFMHDRPFFRLTLSYQTKQTLQSVGELRDEWRRVDDSTITKLVYSETPVVRMFS